MPKGTRYVRFANEGKYHIAFRIAKYIATAKTVISRFAVRQNISLLRNLQYKSPAFGNVKKYRLK